jgi:diguanylate cyclase (GGDEF)-like protein
MGLSVLLTGVFATGLVSLLPLGGLERLELNVFDQLMQQRSDTAADARLLLVTITEADLHRYGWPLSDGVLAEGLALLQAHSPRAIGLDLYRDLTHPPGTADLDRQLQADNLIAIANIVGGVGAPPQVTADRVAFNDLVLDPDGVLRRGLLFVAGDGQDFYSLALRLSLDYLAAEGIPFHYDAAALWFGPIPLRPLEAHHGGYRWADSRGYQTLLNYRNRHSPAPTVSWSELLKGQVAPELIRDRIVLVGTVAPSLKDVIYTPFSDDIETFTMPGVIIHSQIVSHLLDVATGQRPGFRFWPRWGEVLWLMGWALSGSALAWGLGHPLVFGVGSVASLSLIYASSLGLFSQAIWVPVVEPSGGFILALALAMVHRLYYTRTRDPLTGAFNRISWLGRLQRHFQAGSHPLSVPPGVMVVGLNRFEQVNASLGQATGDRLLMLITARLRQILPRRAHLGRISGEDFALAIHDGDQGRLTALAEAIQGVLAEPFWVGQQELSVTASIGIVVPQGGQQATPENLLRDAQTAMYRAQRRSQSRYIVFAASMATAAADQFALETEMRHGIAQWEFVLYYQPIVELETGHIAGFEALVRWQHPRLGFVSPARFIPLAEETGLILPLGDWICRTACYQARQWQQTFPDWPLMVSINLSGQQFEQPHLAQQLGSLLRETGLDGASLKLEITESMVMGDIDVAIDLMLRLKALGCRLGMDDFGTGYSSLSYLRRFPIDTLKVDQSFVHNMSESREDREIVRTIVDLGHTLGMDLIAEGIETQAQAEALRSLSCEYGQGYYWAKPLPADEATALLAANGLPRQQRHLFPSGESPA